jgi:cell division transport system permease protein
MSALGYAVDEALASLWRGRQSGMLATVTIALALFVLGGFLLLTSNLERLGAAWSSAAEMSVYLKDDVTPAERGAIEQVLGAAAFITGREYVSKDAALTRFKQAFGDLALAVDTAGDNPLPASYEVRLRAAQDDRGNVESLASSLRPMAGVADVRYDRQWLDRLQAAITMVRGVGLVLGAVLTIAAALTVGNVVRLALHARSDELEIMRLVGAPQVYIRGPFVMEGLLQGGTGAALALVALLAAFVVVRARYLIPLASTLDVSSVSFLPFGLCMVVVVGGMAVGCVGGFVAAWGR